MTGAGAARTRSAIFEGTATATLHALIRSRANNRIRTRHYQRTWHDIALADDGRPRGTCVASVASDTAIPPFATMATEGTRRKHHYRRQDQQLLHDRVSTMGKGGIVCEDPVELDKELYITAGDVQMQPTIFYNEAVPYVLKKCYILHRPQICLFREATAVIEICLCVTGRALIARRFAIMLSTFVAMHVTATICAADDDQQIRPADQIWLVNSRHLPYGSAACDENIAFEFQQYADACQWNSKDKEAFHATQHQCEQTLIYVHGNRVGPRDVQQRGLQVYRALIDQADEQQQSLRFVIFSWPSTRIRGVLRDARLKAARSVPAAYYLAHLLRRIDPEVKVSLTGYSLGARVITGGLHILAGGELDGLELGGREQGEREQGEPVHPGRKPMCVVLMTAALNDYWLEPDAYHSRTLSQVESLLLLNNHCDAAMKHYGTIERCGSPLALGYRGVASYSALGTEAKKIQQYDVCCHIGRSHDFMLYLCNPKLMSLVWESLNCNQLVEP